MFLYVFLFAVFIILGFHGGDRLHLINVVVNEICLYNSKLRSSPIVIDDIQLSVQSSNLPCSHSILVSIAFKLLAIVQDSDLIRKDNQRSQSNYSSEKMGSPNLQIVSKIIPLTPLYALQILVYVLQQRRCANFPGECLHIVLVFRYGESLSAQVLAETADKLLALHSTRGGADGFNMCPTSLAGCKLFDGRDSCWASPVHIIWSMIVIQPSLIPLNIYGDASLVLSEKISIDMLPTDSCTLSHTKLYDEVVKMVLLSLPFEIPVQILVSMHDEFYSKLLSSLLIGCILHLGNYCL